jgi:hypothetical protein
MPKPVVYPMCTRGHLGEQLLFLLPSVVYALLGESWRRIESSARNYRASFEEIGFVNMRKVLTLKTSGQEREPPFMALPSQPEHLLRALYTHPHSIELQFADRTFSLPVERLEIDAGGIQWHTVAASAGGESMTVTVARGKVIPIDSATLRYLVDKGYAAKIDKSIAALHLSPAGQEESARLSKLTRDPRWNDVGDEDDLFE